MRLNRFAVNLAAIAAVALPGACQSNSRSTAVRTTSGDQTAVNDPCAIQLQDISGAMLMFYALHHALPARLEDLLSVAQVDAPLVFVCPQSGKPYVYAPDGLISPGKTKRIIVYDAEPAHHDARWCIFLTNPTPNSPLTVDVLLVPESLFQTYQPPGQ